MINGDCDPFVRARDPMNKIDRYDRSAAPTSGMEVVTNIPDYYKLLDLDRSASQQAIGDAYRYFAKRCHPATQKNTDVGARERNARLFVLYNEAYEVLGNTKSRAVYDFYGGEAARNGICRETFDYREGAYNRNNAQNPEDCFRKYNYDHSPLPKILRQTTLLKNLLASREKDLEYEAVAPTLKELHLTLEELYNGGIKIIKNDRLVLDLFATGIIPAEHRSLELKIVPGWTNGTRILYPKMGSINMCARTSDLILQVVLDPHPRFRVEDYDIYTTVQISLVDVMGIGPIQIEHLDGRKISVGLTELASPNVAKVIKGQGLARDDLKKNYGDLFVNFDIVFPEEIDPWQKLQLWVALVDYPRPRPPLHYAIAPISAISLQESKGKEVPLDLPRKSQPAAIQLSVSTTSTETAMSRDPGP